MDRTLPRSRLATWTSSTVEHVRENAERGGGIAVESIEIANVRQRLAVPVVGSPRGRRRRGAEALPPRRLQQQGETALVLSFDLEMKYSSSTSATTAAPPPNVSDIYRNAFDTEQERTSYLLRLVRDDREDFDGVESVRASIGDGPPPETGGDGGSSNSNVGVIAGVVAAVVVVLAAAGAGFMVYRRKRKDLPSDSEGYSPTTKSSSRTADRKKQMSTKQQQHPSSARWTNEIVVPQRSPGDDDDDVSALEGDTVFGMMALGQNGAPVDDPTVSVSDVDYDYLLGMAATHKKSTTLSLAATEATGSTALTKLSGLLGVQESVFEVDDNISFDEVYAKDFLEDMEDDDDTKVKPFVVLAPAGRLGVVLGTDDNGNTSVVAIKPDSPLRDRLQKGDIIISIDQQDVTTMVATAVSSLIAQKQTQTQRTLVCARPIPFV
jgi:hypothetical protein